MSNENKDSIIKEAYNRFLKNPWPYYGGAVILGLLNVALLASTGKGWGVCGIFFYWGALFFDLIGGEPEKWAFFADNAKNLAMLNKGFWGNPGSVRNAAIIVGALLTSLLAGQFKFKMLKSWRQLIPASIGGLLMGYGAMTAYGCNIGALFSGTASMSLHGWVFLVFIFFGGIVGSKLLVKFFMK